MRARGRGPGWRYRAVVLCGLAASSVVAGCASTTGATTTGANTPGATTAVTLVPTPGGSTVVGIDRAPTGCNPNTASGDTWADHLVLAAVLPSPFLVDASGQSTQNQALVTSAEPINLSPLTVVYTLDPKAVWQDGVPISAADFIYAWHQQRGTPPAAGEPTPGAATSLGYRDIKSVVGSNHGSTIKVTFATPFSDWQMLFHDLLPAHILEQPGVGWNPSCTSVSPAVDLSGGPYEIHSVVPGHEVVLAANPRWWGPKVNLNRITVRTASGPAQLAGWARHGRAQVVQPSAFGPAFLEGITSDPSLYGAVNISSTFLQLEFATTDPTIVDPRVRAAVAHAVDRQALVDQVVGFADPHLVPSQSHLYVQDQSGYPSSPNAPAIPNPLDAGNQTGPTTTTAPPVPAAAYPTTADLTATSRLLTSAGYSPSVTGTWINASGSQLALRLVVDTGDAWSAATGPLVADQLRAAGILVTVTDAPDTAAAGTALAVGNADLALLPFHATPYPSQAVAWYTPSLGSPGANGSQNWSDLDDPLVNSLLTKAVRELNPVTAQPYYDQADQELWNQMAALPLFAEPSAMAWWGRLYDVSPNPHGPGLLWNVATWENQIVRRAGSGSPGG